MNNIFLYFFIFLSWLLIQPDSVYGAQNRSTADQVEYEFGLYHFYNRDFIQSSFQFKKVLKEYPRFDRTRDVIKFYLLSLAALQQNGEIKKIINLYKEQIDPDTIFSIVDHFRNWGNDKAALDILKAIYIDKLSSIEKDTYNYLMAVTNIYMNYKPDVWIGHIKEISSESDYYFTGNILYSQVLFRDRNFDLAISTLQDLLVKKPAISIENQISLLLGKMYFEKKEYSKSIEYFNSVKSGVHLYDALEGLYWSYFKKDDFLQAGETLKIVQSQFKRKFDENFLLYNIAYSYFMAGEYVIAKKYFSQLSDEIEIRKKIMNSLLNDENICKKMTFTILREYFNSNTKEDLQLKSLDMDYYQKIPKNLDFLILSDIYSSTDKLSVDASRIINQGNNSYSSFQNKFGVIKQFYDDFKHKNKKLDERYESLKTRVDKLELSVGGTKHNENYFKEWLESNISDYSDELNRDMTDFEKKIVQMFTHEIIYQQKIDKTFINKIIISPKSLENVHTASLTKWTERAEDILSAYEKNFEDLEKIKKIKDDLKGYLKTISELQERILQHLFKKVKKEAFRVLIDMESIEKDVLADYAIIQKNLPVEMKPSM